MQLTRPISFRPLFFERVWGGRKLARFFGKSIPPEVPIGESWELVDREEAQSVVADGPLAGKTLNELWNAHRAEVFGRGFDRPSSRFPLLVKILDAREKLSVQVHPPAAAAAALKGEPKTEMWHILQADPGADIYVGLRSGVTRQRFEQALTGGGGAVADLLHRIEVRPGDTMYMPSGRVHAIGAGNLLFEVQQNSDTTYRVYDWDRTGLDGKPRDLHLPESLASIDFGDTEPPLQTPVGERLIDCPLFAIERWELAGLREAAGEGESALFLCVSGKVRCGDREFAPGEIFLVAASGPRLLEPAVGGAVVVRTTA